MEPEKPRIEIFEPFGAALDLTKKILFQPFDAAKWCILGFAAFLSGLGGGGVGNGLNYTPDSGGKGDWSFRSATHDATDWLESVPPWLIALIVVLIAVVIVLVVVLTWVGARGRFIFTDCVVRNRGAIVEPWKEFKREGNSLFFFWLTTGLIILLLLGLLALPLWWPLARHGIPPEGAAMVVGFALLAGAFIFVLLPWALVTTFIPPIMYRRRCGALQGLRESFGLIMSAPGSVILFFLFAAVIWIAIFLVACVMTCLTCCLAAIPYVGTVILLPLHVFWMSYLLLFIRQFGAEYDVWPQEVRAEAEALPIPEALNQDPPAPPESPSLPPPL